MEKCERLALAFNNKVFLQLDRTSMHHDPIMISSSSSPEEQPSSCLTLRLNLKQLDYIIRQLRSSPAV